MCPITVIVGLALRDNAFDAPSLTSARRVFNVRNLGPVQCTPLRWKEEKLKVPVLRRMDDGPPPATSDPIRVDPKPEPKEDPGADTGLNPSPIGS